MIDCALSSFGRLDILVNNAGVMDDMASVADFLDSKHDYVIWALMYMVPCVP